MEQATHSEEMRQVMVLMERMGDDIKLLAEGQSDIRRDIEGMKSDISDLKSDVADLKSGQASLKSDVADLKSGQSQILEYLYRSEEDSRRFRQRTESRFSVLEGKAGVAGLVRDGKPEMEG